MVGLCYWILFRTRDVIWIVWSTMREWLEVDLSPDKSFTIRVHFGPYDVDVMTKFAFVKSLISMEVSNTEGLQMSVDKVELLIKGRDLEHDLEFCDIIVTGTIL